MRFKSPAGQIEHSVANDVPQLQHFFERSYVVQAQGREDGCCQLATCFGVLQQV